MGYNTRFKGSVTGPKELLDAFKEDAENGNTYGEYNQPLDDWTYGEFFGGDTAKWYGWAADMESISEQYPHLLFALEGEGEESGDIWKAWARNGMVVSVRARVVFDEPNLDEVLPSPDAAKAIEQRREAKRKEIDAEIARLEKEKELI